MANKEYSLAHTKWMCKYHIVFTPKYRRKIIYNQYKEDLRDIIKHLCNYKGVEIIEGHLIVCCKIEIYKVAKPKWTMLHVQKGQKCIIGS